MKAAQTVIGLGLVLLFPHCGGPNRIPPPESDAESLEPGASRSFVDRLAEQTRAGVATRLSGARNRPAARAGSG